MRSLWAPSSATQREDDGSAALATRTSKAPPLSEKPLGAKLRDQAPRPSSATNLEEDGSAALAATKAPRPNSRNSQARYLSCWPLAFEKSDQKAASATRFHDDKLKGYRRKKHRPTVAKNTVAGAPTQKTPIAGRQNTVQVDCLEEHRLLTQ